MIPRAVFKLILFNTLLVGSCGYAFLRGGAPERAIAAILLIGVVLTFLFNLQSPRPFASVDIAVLIVDIGAFVGFTIVALRANRFWTLWVSALAGLGVLGHLSRFYGGTGISDWAYAVSLTIWSYPITVLIAIGTFNYHRGAHIRQRTPA